MQKEKTLQSFTNKKEMEQPVAPNKKSLVSHTIQQLLTLKGAEYDALYKEVENSLNETGRTILRDRNFLLIQEQLLKYLKTSQNGLPTVTQLSLLTNLSRVTVGKHLKEMMSTELDDERKLQHKYLFDVILTNIGRRAINGDIKYSKLYLDILIRLEEKDSIKTYIQNQQNNIVVSSEK